MTIGFLMQLDKLISLIESPTFVQMRLQLLEADKHPYLIKIFYGLLMVLPQNRAFNSLRVRLYSASSFGLLDCALDVLDIKKDLALLEKSQSSNSKTDALKINPDALFTHFVNIQEKFKHKRLTEMDKSSFLMDRKDQFLSKIPTLDIGIGSNIQLNNTEVVNKPEQNDWHVAEHIFHNFAFVQAASFFVVLPALLTVTYKYITMPTFICI
ncbi:hypothetical protein RFI_13498 [Reticulomyxa filosa]|uniref:Vacuolar protein 14 C-terminal Fig4-binding domain-containing protein n=1 Tax=Reticulomyxa filosa TaxID=46433 RepID=X6NCR0_RETFI|nr:hypothetical protein RFI_13498 [Reticulomyxa filosa]|eukprot:ETO23683.1 hypothetical protein RFI_13498 [Reticulomyxa filosa]